MKKYLAFGLSIVLMTTLFTSCSIFKGEADDESTTESTNVKQEDLPTVTDADGNVVDYSVTEQDDETDTNLYFSVGSLDDINRQAGTNIKSPKNLVFTDEEFDVDDTVSPKIASYSFIVKGVDYTVLASKKTDGLLRNIYLKNGTKFGENLEGKQAFAPKQIEKFCVARWFDGDVQYNLVAENVSLEDFKAVYNSVK